MLASGDRLAAPWLDQLHRQHRWLPGRLGSGELLPPPVEALILRHQPSFAG
jgi:hypothetical protein